MESPKRSKDRRDEELSLINQDLNLMMTYDSSSDFQVPYGIKGHLPQPLTSLPPLPGPKNHTAVTLVSNCDSASRQSKLDELRPLLDFDVFGKCGKRSVHPGCNNRRKDGNHECLTALSKDYKFYLAFENSDCTDYITEKVWINSFRFNMVPIVWSPVANYHLHLPPMSYIDRADFNSTKEFADYIKLVADTPTLYAQYHMWRKRYFAVAPNNTQVFLRLCEYSFEHQGVEKPAVDVASLRSLSNCL
jgi:glycoprotein 3-alpha-L-fucosyltransferase